MGVAGWDSLVYFISMIHFDPQPGFTSFHLSPCFLSETLRSAPLKFGGKLLLKWPPSPQWGCSVSPTTATVRERLRILTGL